MLIKDLFVKPINRDIKGVVKVGQDEEEIIKQELEEYVVTRELQKHFRDFFSSYKRSINGQTDKMGVWVSGFFGSGKSHFIKILSYLLENRQVDGKSAIDYFIEDEKIDDSMVLADMKLASSIATDTILFNIDSQSETSGGKDKNSILNVFLKVFNEKLGYSPNPHLAELERQLNDSGIYSNFKEKYKEITDEEWVNSRRKFNFLKDKVVQTLIEINFMSEATADDWAHSTVQPYQISIIQFAEMINEYIKTQGENHHIVFLVDEMGQYVGDNTDLMLNLQTITEDLGSMCQGKAWVVVTSQQDIDSITEVVGNDFSKIQGRFNTRLSLTSANVDEVIKLRILEKTDTANQTLAALYENKETIIKNLIIFNDGIEKKLYENKKDFSQVYPFIPYHFNILSSVLTSIRKYGASGKHLSEGERSMLALFKESAEKLKDQEHGAIIPFNIFYGALNRFLDHSHSVVISKALDNEKINPDKEEDNFNVNVLKTLFMIKYVKEIEANLENITTLMVSSIDEDRISLKENVENALKILVKQTLVQKNGEEYIFLTDEEQEINREIQNQEVQSSDMIRKVSELIFADIFPEDRIQVAGKAQYVFPFNRSIDDQPYGPRQNFDYGVEIITPYSSLNGNESTLKMQSVEGNNVFVELPNDADFLEELRTGLQIEKFLNSPSARNIPNYEEIRAVKGVEMKEHQKRGKTFLESALSEAKFYVNGDVLNLSGSHFKNNLTQSLERVVDMVYHKLDYITDPMDNSDIYKLFKVDDSYRLDLEETSSQNPNAIRDVLDYIQLMTQSHATISLKEIKNRFNKAPYGFLDSDIEWIIAKVFTDGNIKLSMHGKEVSFVTDSNDKIIDYITKNKFADKLLIEEKEKISDHEKRSLKLISQEVFQKNMRSNDSDRMIVEFKQEAQKIKEELNIKLSLYREGNYPGKETIREGLELMKEVTLLDSVSEIFSHLLEKEDDYLDFAEDYQAVKGFLEGEQKRIWDRSEELISIYDDSRSYIADANIELVADEINKIMKQFHPYNQISQLPDLNKQFIEVYDELLNKESEPVEEVIELEKERVLKSLKNNNLEDQYLVDFREQFNQLLNRLKESNNIARINGFEKEAESLRQKLLNQINLELDRREREEERKRAQKEAEAGEDETAINDDPIKFVKPVKRNKYININKVNPATAWEIETKEDIDQYLNKLRVELEKELAEDTIITIDF